MSPSILDDSAQAQWFAQLTEMREALAELKLNATQQDLGEQEEDYGRGIDLDDACASDLSWDEELWSSADDSQDGTELNGSAFPGVEAVTPPDSLESSGHGRIWLDEACVDFASRHPGIVAAELQEQITALLSSENSGIATFLLSLVTHLTKYNRR